MKPTKPTSSRRVGRRQFLQTTALGAAGLAIAMPHVRAAQSSTGLEVGEGSEDITPPIGTVMAGFHYAPGKERRVEGVRRPTAARAIVLRAGGKKVALVSVDLLGVSKAMAKRIRTQIAEKSRIAPADVRVIATHSHSTPTGHPLLLWGGEPRDYLATVERSIVRAVMSAIQDLAPAELHVGKDLAPGANFNRTRKEWKNEKDFSADASDTERWLDREVHVLHFERMAPKKNILWYHFSAHPVCYTDRNAGPDWPGVVREILERENKLTPSLLQGHIGDVNPGGGDPWLGIPETTGKLVASAIQSAMGSAKKVRVEAFKTTTKDIGVPLDMEAHREQLEEFRTHPEKCDRDEWVNKPFAEAWYKTASKWEFEKSRVSTEISALVLGDVALFFHAAELFSYYGLRIRHESPFAHSILVGYTNEFIGYLADPTAHEKREYAAAVVPKIVGYPPFTPTASRSFTHDSVEFLKSIQG